MADDQYGDPIPDDLVYLDWDHIDHRDPETGEFAGHLDAWQKRMLIRLNTIPWYEIVDHRSGQALLAVSWRAMSHHFKIFPGDTSLEDVGVPGLDQCDISRVPETLKRGSADDGFYHA